MVSFGNRNNREKKYYFDEKTRERLPNFALFYRFFLTLALLLDTLCIKRADKYAVFLMHKTDEREGRQYVVNSPK